MKVKTHQVIAHTAYELVKAYLPITFNEKAISLGAGMPDLAPHRRFKAHNIKVAAKEWVSFTEFVHKRRYTIWLISYAAGIMSHYISDTFCYAHNFHDLSLRQHRKYEVYMHRHIRDLTQHFDISLIFKKWNELRKKGIDAYIYMENESYKAEIANCHTMHERMELDVNKAVLNSAVWMLEIAFVRYPTFIEGVAAKYA